MLEGQTTESGKISDLMMSTRGVNHNHHHHHHHNQQQQQHHVVEEVVSSPAKRPRMDMDPALFPLPNMDTLIGTVD